MTTEATTTKRLGIGAVKISNEERMKKETSCAISIKPSHNNPSEVHTRCPLTGQNTTEKVLGSYTHRTSARLDFTQTETHYKKIILIRGPKPCKRNSGKDPHISQYRELIGEFSGTDMACTTNSIYALERMTWRTSHP
ncbi:hypothetical protein YC2023_099446 [Brassica napus]